MWRRFCFWNVLELVFWIFFWSSFDSRPTRMLVHRDRRRNTAICNKEPQTVWWEYPANIKQMGKCGTRRPAIHTRVTSLLCLWFVYWKIKLLFQTLLFNEKNALENKKECVGMFSGWVYRDWCSSASLFNLWITFWINRNGKFDKFFKISFIYF